MKQLFQNSEHMFVIEDIKLVRNVFIVENDKRNQRILWDEYFILNLLSYCLFTGKIFYFKKNTL